MIYRRYSCLVSITIQQWKCCGRKREKWTWWQCSFILIYYLVLLLILPNFLLDGGVYCCFHCRWLLWRRSHTNVPAVVWKSVSKWWIDIQGIWGILRGIKREHDQWWGLLQSPQKCLEYLGSAAERSCTDVIKRYCRWFVFVNDVISWCCLSVHIFIMGRLLRWWPGGGADSVTAYVSNHEVWHVNFYQHHCVPRTGTIFWLLRGNLEFFCLAGATHCTD